MQLLPPPRVSPPLIRRQSGETPLHTACKFGLAKVGHVAVARLLLDRGAAVGVKDCVSTGSGDVVFAQASHLVRVRGVSCMLCGNLCGVTA